MDRTRTTKIHGPGGRPENVEVEVIVCVDGHRLEFTEREARAVRDSLLGDASGYRETDTTFRTLLARATGRAIEAVARLYPGDE